jgi:transcriptional activator SPT8
VHNQGLWLLSGLESGGINLQSVRHDEGKRIACLRQHTSAVSVLNLAPDERSVLSGSWDKTVLDWDLNTGQVKRSFDGSGGQVSALEKRPLSSLPIPETTNLPPATNGTLASNNEDEPKSTDEPATADLPNGKTEGDDAPDPNAALSPVDSLFGGGEDDDLFGESANDGGAAVDLGLDDDDNDFSRAIARDIREGEPAAGDVNMLDAPTGDVESKPNGEAADSSAPAEPAAPQPSEPAPLTNGLPHAEDTEMQDASFFSAPTDQLPAADTTFLAASIDGSIHIWDKRQQSPAAQILPRNAPPWCMGACWSPDGNFIYAGRRNGTVEEYSLLNGLRQPERTFRFPQGSGPVSAVRAMPNGRHLVCASHDILRLYDLQHTPSKGNNVPFLIVPGHRTGTISQLFIDQSCRFMISTAGTRGWEGSSTQVLLGYEINI